MRFEQAPPLAPKNQMKKADRAVSISDAETQREVEETPAYGLTGFDVEQNASEHDTSNAAVARRGRNTIVPIGKW